MGISITLLSARYGDSIVVKYGVEKISIILIDGGTSGTKFDIKSAICNDSRSAEVELCVVTHIDRDHIEGILTLLEEDMQSLVIEDFWFNGFKHLPDENNKLEKFGGVQGDRLSLAIDKHRINWNKNFNSNPIYVPEDGPLPCLTLPGGMKIILLSPQLSHLAKLKKQWIEEIQKNNLDKESPRKIEEELQPDIERFGAPDVESLFELKGIEDQSSANGSSIAFLAQYENKNILFSGDAHPSTILASLNRLFGNLPIKIDAWKLSHHGSSHNTSKDLIERIDCKQYLISTSSTRFPHPSAETIAWILKLKKGHVELVFNYSTSLTKVWDEESLKVKYDYTTKYPELGTSGLTFSL